MSSLYDLDHTIGSDIQFSGVGDLATVTGTLRGQQRVLRRLFTTLGNYIWNPNYGGSVGQRVGQLFNQSELKSQLLEQMFLEDSVTQSPAPTITVQGLTTGAVVVIITYIDSESLKPVTLSLDPANPPFGPSS